MKNGWRRFAAVALLAGCFLATFTARAQSKQETRAASVLFNQFETVAYAQTGFLLRHAANDPSDVDSEDVLMFPFFDLIGGLKALGSGVVEDLPRSYSAVLAGSKDFGAKDVPQPTGLGEIHSHMCYIGIPKRGAKPDIEADFRHAARISMNGMQVWTWTVPRSEEESKAMTFYATQVAGSYLLLANTRQEFQQAVKALASAANAKVAPTSVFDWKTFSTHQYWMYRSFRRSGVNGADAAGNWDLPADVSAITFFADLDKRASFLQILCSDKSMKVAPKILPGSATYVFQPQGAGVWQASIALSKDEAGFDALFVLFYRFGFGAIL